MSEKKDSWDKLDILSKPIIATLAALSLYIWNNERTKQNTALTMSQIAVSVLGGSVSKELDDPLRDWAIEVLQDPSDPPKLSDEAAMQLRRESLPVGLFDLAGTLDNLNELSELLDSSLEGLDDIYLEDLTLEEIDPAPEEPR